MDKKFRLVVHSMRTMKWYVAPVVGGEGRGKGRERKKERKKGHIRQKIENITSKAAWRKPSKPEKQL